jgi:hypothetical protein
LPAQSELDVQAELAAQSALLVAPPPHRPVVVSHKGPAGLPVQSALLVQALLHWLNGPHTWPLAQSVIAPQLQTGRGPMPPSGKPMGLRGHCVPPAALAQSAMLEHPHVCVVVSHTGPSRFVAQSALALHALSQWVRTQTEPVGHPLVAVQPHHVIDLTWLLNRTSAAMRKTNVNTYSFV